MEVRGHEDPVFVGTSRNITCTTTLSVMRMEWLLLGVREAIEEREDGGRSLTLPLNPNNTRLNGTKFTCRITIFGRKNIEITITVKIRGEMYNLYIWSHSLDEGVVLIMFYCFRYDSCNEYS